MHQLQPQPSQSSPNKTPHVLTKTVRGGQTAPPSRLLQLPAPPATRPATVAYGGETRELRHDARNLISALSLYCDLLAAPGVLAPGFGCYAEDLRRLAASGAGLIEALTAGRSGLSARGPLAGPLADLPSTRIEGFEKPRRPFPGIEDLGAELIDLERPLRALAGPQVRVEIECAPCAGRLALNSEDLLRILFNLVANALEAMASTPAELRRSPFLRITAQRGGAASFLPRRKPLEAETVVLSVRDNGPGIAAAHLPHIFEPGFSTRYSPLSSPASGTSEDAPGEDSRGLGLAIVRRLVATAGGAVRAISPSGLGARFDIEIPVLRMEAESPRLKLARPAVQRKIPGLQQIPAQIEKEA